MSKESLMDDLLTITHALGEGSPLHGFILLQQNDGVEIVSIAVEVEVDHAVFSYTSDDDSTGQRRYDIESPTDQFQLDRFNVFIFGQTVPADTAARRTTDGTTTFHF